jgi:hypothetical protein
MLGSSVSGTICTRAPQHAARALAVACVAALPSIAYASELSWEGPAACSERDQLSFQIEQALGTPLAKLADLQFLVQVERAEAPFVARLRVTRPGSEAARERVLTGPDCAKLVDTLTVAVALALGEYDRVDEKHAAFEPVLAPALPAPHDPAPPAAAAAPAEKSKEAADRLRAGALALLVSDFGSLPEPGLGAAVGLELGWRALRLQLTGTMFFDQHIEVEPLGGAPAGADLNLAVGAVRGCTNVLDMAASRFAVPLCGGVELGRLAGVGQGVLGARERSVFWVAVLLEAGAFWHVPRTALRLGALLTAVAPLNRDEFVLRGIGSVHQPSSLVGRGSVGLGVDFE